MNKSCVYKLRERVAPLVGQKAAQMSDTDAPQTFVDRDAVSVRLVSSLNKIGCDRSNYRSIIKFVLYTAATFLRGQIGGGGWEGPVRLEISQQSSTVSSRIPIWLPVLLKCRHSGDKIEIKQKQNRNKTAKAFHGLFSVFVLFQLYRHYYIQIYSLENGSISVKHANENNTAHQHAESWKCARHILCPYLSIYSFVYYVPVLSHRQTKLHRCQIEQKTVAADPAWQ